MRYCVSLFVLASIFYHPIGKAQVASNDTVLGLLQTQTHLISSAHISEFAFKDNMLSPLIYKGTGVGMLLGFEKNKLHKVTNACTNWSKAKIYNSLQSRQYSATTIYFNASLGVSYKISHFKRRRFNAGYLGWQVAQHSDFRRIPQFQNASLNYNLSISAGPRYRASGNFNLKENNKRKLLKKGFEIDWNYQIDLPVAAFVTRPNYNSIRQLNDGNGKPYQNSVTQEAIQNLRFYTLNKFISLNQMLEFTHVLNTHNKLGFQFKWNFEYFNKEFFAYTTSHSGAYLCLYTKLK